MLERTMHILEYDKIIHMLAGYAGSPKGRQLCLELEPDTELSKIKAAQRETTDALNRIYKKGSVSFSGIRDLSGSLLRLKVGASIGISELLDLACTLETALRVKTWGRRDPDEEDRDCLDTLFDLIEPLSNLAREIRRCILDEENIADDASPALKAVRRQIRLTNDKIHSQLTSMVNSQAMSTRLQDNLITMRNGRYCLPVKAEFRSQVPGMVHDQSASGSTVFIEPMAVVKLNNDLRELAAQEKQEIEKILEDLSGMAAENQAFIQQDIAVLSRLDFIFARASFSKSYSGTEPVFNENGLISLKKARHPLLDKKKVVPIDVVIGTDYRMLIVTGPNTGGKTVSLKTVGLLTLMGQAGLHIPAFEHSQLSVFDGVYADIGDEQSIEQSLSTFSAHMTNIVSILQQADDRSLVLFDELCAGTDPAEGAALAMSILRHLLDRGVTAMATTHYSELKVFAMSTPGVCNASCEFDIKTLSPTYRLLIGIPGKSNAFAISGKLGLPEDIIEQARQSIDENQQNFENLLADLEQNRITIEKEQEKIAAYKEQITGLRQKLEEKQVNIDQQKKKILDDARQKAQNILQDAKDYADHTIRTMNKLAAGGGVNMKEMEQVRARTRKKLDQAGGRKVQTRVNKKYGPGDFKPGEGVHVISLNVNGIIVGKPNGKGELTVQMGILKSRIPYSDLEPLGEPAAAETKTERSSSTGAGSIGMNKTLSVSTSLNVIGKTSDEAVSMMDKYLDDAYLAHLHTVTIIHGRGTGALKKAVARRLGQISYVKSFRPGNYDEGGIGTTIVELK